MINEVVSDHGDQSRPFEHSRRSEVVSDDETTRDRRGQVRWSPVPPLYKRDRRTTEPSDAPRCVRGNVGRVLADRHGESCPGAGCTGCEPCPSAHCQACRREHVGQDGGTCPACVGMVRDNLADLERLMTLLPVQAVTGRQAYHHHDGVPGGDAVVMLVPATPRWHGGWLGSMHPEHPGDPRPPLDALARWVRLWLDLTGAHVERAPLDVGEAVAFLDAGLNGFARHPRFADMARDVARVLHAVENVVHAGNRPEVSRVPCWDCGTRLHRVWADTEPEDHWKCPSCGEVYDHGRYERAKRDHLHSRDADRFVALRDAVAVTGRPESTVRAWMADGYVEARRGPTGRLEVWWPDVRDRHAVVPQRKPRKRSPSRIVAK